MVHRPRNEKSRLSGRLAFGVGVKMPPEGGLLEENFGSCSVLKSPQNSYQHLHLAWTSREMGIFRVMLALAVFAAHIEGFFDQGKTHPLITRDVLHVYVWSGHAVFAFFIISGFYMAMVICEKYSKMEGGTRKFYLNRALRLYPANWVMLATIALFMATIGMPNFLLMDSPDGRHWLNVGAILAHVFFFGSETIAFSDPHNWYYVFGPVWSLSLEVYFYVLAPFIVVRSKGFIAALALASLALRLSLYFAGFGVVPWRYFFFPSDFVFFLMGVLAYHAYASVRNASWFLGLRPAMAIAMFAIVLYKPFWNFGGQDNINSWIFYGVIAICTPFAFDLTRKSVIDNFIGQLSYPIYIGHTMMNMITDQYSGPIDKSVRSLIGVVVFAMLVYFAVDGPIEKLRAAISRRKLDSHKMAQDQPCNAATLSDPARAHVAVRRSGARCEIKLADKIDGGCAG
ncbi:acyltransferase family protein [Burkholderia multivorans]|uniref:acyltransferase family protein n=1 Tax=Burkholderia multivorans TaxID=87883 RepID=UPI0021C0F5C5|nr:acyltransferase [Burkholderia multivorans]